MRNRRKGTGRKLIVMLLSICMAGVMAPAAHAAQKETTYTVRLFAGAHGTVGGGEVLVFKGLKYGSPLPFSQRSVALEEGSKYYIMGIRESGRDNNTALSVSEMAKQYTVTEDRDYVAAYGIRGNTVAYTVQFHTQDGTELAPEETYYGNVGDEPVVAFLYIDGYLPQAYNLTGTLKSNPEENVFTFVYTPVSPAAAAAGAQAGAAAGGTGTGTAGTGTAPAATQQTGAADAAAAAAAAETEGVEPEDLMRIGDEETPLGNQGADNGEDLENLEDEKTPLGSGEFATMLWDIPAAGKVGILSVLILAGLGVGYLYARRKGKTGNAKE